MKTWIILLGITMMSSTIHAQTIGDTSLIISQKNKGLCIDKQQQVVAYDTDGFKTYSKEGKQINTYTSTELGELVDMDINPAGQIILLFNNMPQLLILDRNQIEIGRIKTEQIKIDETSLCCFSNDGNIWLYKKEDQTIVKMDFNGNIRQVFTKLVIPRVEAFQPTDMIEEGNEIFFADSTNGIYVFDYYGRNKNKLDFKGVSKIQAIEKNLFFVQEKDAILYQPKTFIKTNVFKSNDSFKPKEAVIAGSNMILSDGWRLFFMKINP